MIPRDFLTKPNKSYDFKMKNNNDDSFYLKMIEEK